ncbi:MAG: nucleotidyl transferase AbiEii/AbiGii toxin family protein [Sulfurospirillum sp.]
MDSINYKKLYALQDRVMQDIFQVESEFYLTGGTCLSRFYKDKRYSDDLDFFTNNSIRFNFAVRGIKDVLIKRYDLKVEIESKDFIRYRLDDILQIDFVNDRVEHYKDLVVKENIIIDNIENILSNKLTATISRDNPKDIFDLYLIWRYFSFDWKDILESAHSKAYFSDDELIIRLKTFPSELLKNIKLSDKSFLDNFTVEFPKIIQEIKTSKHAK